MRKDGGSLILVPICPLPEEGQSTLIQTSARTNLLFPHAGIGETPPFLMGMGTVRMFICTYVYLCAYVESVEVVVPQLLAL